MTLRGVRRAAGRRRADIRDGIGLDFMTYVAVTAGAGRFNQIRVASAVIAVAFAAKFIMMWD